MELFVIIIFGIIMTKSPNPVAAENLVGTAASCVPLVLIKSSLWMGFGIGSVENFLREGFSSPFNRTHMKQLLILISYGKYFIGKTKSICIIWEKI